MYNITLNSTLPTKFHVLVGNTTVKEFIIENMQHANVLALTAKKIFFQPVDKFDYSLIDLSKSIVFYDKTSELRLERDSLENNFMIRYLQEECGIEEYYCRDCEYLVREGYFVNTIRYKEYFKENDFGMLEFAHGRLSI